MHLGIGEREVNYFRKKLSSIKSSKTLSYFNRSNILNIILSDERSNRIDAISSGLSVPQKQIKIENHLLNKVINQKFCKKKIKNILKKIIKIFLLINIIIRNFIEIWKDLWYNVGIHLEQGKGGCQYGVDI